MGPDSARANGKESHSRSEKSGQEAVSEAIKAYKQGEARLLQDRHPEQPKIVILVW